jgi:hypothetical protein
MEIPNIYDLPFDIPTVRMRTMLYKFVLFLEACINVGCAVFFFTYFSASYQIANLNLDLFEHKDLYILLMVVAVAFSV